ncbi:MAG: hypothetical protein LBL73_00155 [Synergistaceae bacterium]|nr:hypothetical protein [Synergistaceae bacterium]
MTGTTQKEQEEFESVLKTPEGGRVIAALLDFCGVYRSSYRLGMEHQHDTAFREGQRDVGLMLLKRIKDCDGGEMILVAAQSQRRKRYEEAARDE